MIAIATGGTAGHVVPALAVAEVLAQRGASVLFVGGDRAERELVPAAGFPLMRVGGRGGLRRSAPLRSAAALTRTGLAVPGARRLLRRESVAAVLGGGGYVAAPVLAAATSMRVPFVLTEADGHLGLTNRAFAPLARRVCLALPIEGRSGQRYRVTGRPVAAVTVERDAARASFGIGAQELSVLVCGGSLGARSINEAALAGLDAAGFHVLHITGSRDWATFAGRAHGAAYELREKLEPHAFQAALAACDLVVARAGGSVFEIAAHSRPAILVPYPHASGDHQASNAAWMERAGAAVVIDDAQLTGPRLAAEVGRLLGDPGRLVAMSRASRSLARPDAAAAVAEEVLAAAAQR